MSRQSRAALAAFVGLVIGLGTLAGVVIALWNSGSDESDQDAAPFTDALDTGAAETLPPVETTLEERTTTIELGGFPNALAVGAGGVWVVRDGRRVIRIDPRTGQIIARAGAGDDLGSERPCGIDVGAGAVWVTTLSGNVARINPETNRVGASIGVEGAACVAVGAGGVWVTSPDLGVVTRIDPATNEVVAEIPVGDFPQGIATGSGSVWVASWDPPDGGEGFVTRIDRRTNEVSQTIPVEAGPEFVVAGPSGVWVTGNDGAVRRIDPRANEVEGEPIRIANEGRTTIALGGGSVWATVLQEEAEEGVVRRIDASSGEVVGEPIPVGETPVGLAYGARALWATNYDDGTVTSYVPPQ